MISVEGLRYRYGKKEREIIHGIDFQINRGEIFGFLGPSGAGKSTTQKILTGLNRGYNGRAQIKGTEIKDQGREFYEHIGVSFELPNLYLQFTALENLNFFASFYNRPITGMEELLERVGLLEFKDKRVSTFSKGMKMRLNFIRALLNSPEILFLDEPTSGLDPVNSALIKELILEQKREGVTTFITTHNMQVAAELCDRVAFIVDGEIKLIDSPKNLMYQYGERELTLEYFKGEETLSEVFNLDDLGQNNNFLSKIRDFKIKSLHSSDATLDDIFLHVTGRSLS